MYDYTFAHEIGHIQGADHDRRVQPENQSGFEYGHGYVYRPSNWRTI
ncbi:MAG: zinc-dependent metalloprotease, partial [Anaerolineae bacterium]|nr:zinc-dependent metalloprotease [Anaerolineae bacterium]